MRINLKNAVSFEIVNEKELGGKLEKGVDKIKFKFVGGVGVVRKARIEVDFGNFKRALCFDSQEAMENFVNQYLPIDIDGCNITTI